MANRGWLWAFAVAWVVLGCSGKVLQDSAGAAGAATRAVEPRSNAGNAGLDLGDVEPGRCAGSIAQSAGALGFNCPEEFCAAKVMASACSALPAGTIKTSMTSCATGLGARSIRFELSAARLTICYYASAASDGSSALVAAASYDDGASFCGGTATHIAGGDVTTDCDDSITVTWCDLAHPEQNQPGEGTPTGACSSR